MGNKSDLVNKRTVRVGAMEEVAKQFGFESFETSAIDGSNVDSAFNALVFYILNPAFEMLR